MNLAKKKRKKSNSKKKKFNIKKVFKVKKSTKKRIIAFVSLFVFLASAVGGTLATALTVGSKTSYNFADDVEVAKGIDVSEHNGRIDWEKAKDEIDFAFIRAGYSGYSNGQLVADAQARRNLKKANKNEIPVGVYFYSQAITVEEAIKEAEFTLRLVRHYDIGLPIVIDVEYAYEKDGKIGGRLYDAKLKRKEATAIINAFCSTVEKAGYQSACYASTNFYNVKIDTKNLNKSIHIWVADYNKNLTYRGEYEIWQYTNRGKCSGVNSKYVDWNNWYNKKVGI